MLYPFLGGVCSNIQHFCSNMNKDLQDHILKTYFTIRVEMALIGILFPPILLFGGLLIGVNLQGSISAYYHTPMRNVFVGSLFAIGTFLYSYRGFKDSENIALNFAGICALCVALLPTSTIVDLKCDTFTAPYLHGISATCFFFAIAYVCIFTSSDTLDTKKSEVRHTVMGEDRRNFYKGLYKVIGSSMIMLPLLSALLLHLWGETQIIILVVEFVCVWTFGIYWIVKSLEIFKTQQGKT